MKKPTLKERLQYWFDNRMSKGTLGLIKLLTIATLIVVLVITIVLVAFRFSEDTPGNTAFDTFATVINAWMPAAEDGGPGYLIMMSIAAIIGLLVTSVLIGIVSSAIEEKITNLKKGNSKVIEKNHIVILGFYAGDYTLINQIATSYEGQKKTILIASETDQEEVKDNIEANVEERKGIKYIYRCIDLLSPADLEICGIQDAEKVIIAPSDDERTTKILLAVSSSVKEDECKTRIIATIQKRKYMLPETMTKKHNIVQLNTNNIIARIIAHSCTQPGLSIVFDQIFDFSGIDIHLVEFSPEEIHTFKDALLKCNNCIPLGVYNKKHGPVLNPSGEAKLESDDKIVVLSVDGKPANTVPGECETIKNVSEFIENDTCGKTLVIGYNETLDLIVDNLPDSEKDLVLIPLTEDDLDAVKEIAEIKRKRNISVIERLPNANENLRDICADINHVVLLSNYNEEGDSADVDSTLLLYRLRDIREKYKLTYNITVEMRTERGQLLASGNDNTDFIVSSNMSSLFLAQLSKTPELTEAFKEILSNAGNEILLKSKELFELDKETYTLAELKRAVKERGYVLIGHTETERDTLSTGTWFDTNVEEEIPLNTIKQFIVMGEK